MQVLRPLILSLCAKLPQPLKLHFSLSSRLIYHAFFTQHCSRFANHLRCGRDRFGADLGAAFGSGASGSLFGATGSANFLSRSTAVAATVFFCSTIALTLASGAFNKSARQQQPGGVLSTVEQTADQPAASQELGTEGVKSEKSTPENQIPR